MKTYEVTITETLQKTVTVEADSREEAERQVEENWNNSEYISTAALSRSSQAVSMGCNGSKTVDNGRTARQSLLQA